MGKKNSSQDAAAKSAAASSEEFNKLTPEKQAAQFKALQEKNAALSGELDDAKGELKQAKGKLKEAKVVELPSFEVEEDEEADIEGGEYQFTCPTFTWDDNSVIDVRELIADAEGKDKKAAQAAQVILSELVARKSGIVRRKED